MNLPDWIPEVPRPWDPEKAETWDAMSTQERQVSFLIDAAIVLAVGMIIWVAVS